MEKFAKTPDQIAEQLEHWFLDYHDREKSHFTGSEAFTLFHLLPREKQNQIKKKVRLHKREKAVLFLSCDRNGCIVNTTERFILLPDLDPGEVPGGMGGVEVLAYQDFNRHTGFASLFIGEYTDAKQGVKPEGHPPGFGLEKRNGEVLRWSIPPGRPGLAFWNVTKKCELIGRKYL